MLGKPVRTDGDAPAFVSPASDFWREHLFDTGTAGETEILWVVYRNRGAEISALELHRLTQQAIVPLTAPVVHIVATSLEDGEPDLNSLRAFEIPVGKGLCMRRDACHEHRVHLFDAHSPFDNLRSRRPSEDGRACLRKRHQDNRHAHARIQRNLNVFACYRTRHASRSFV
jgi:ureidoglycolate hydrolase